MVKSRYPASMSSLNENMSSLEDWDLKEVDEA